MEQTIQGPITGKGRIAADPSLKGKTTQTAPEPEVTTQATPEPESGRAEPEKGTSKEKQAPKVSAAEESFLGDQIDYESLSDEGKKVYESLNKQFKSAYTKKLEPVKKERQKAEAYDAFMANPEQSLKTAAQQYGYKMVPMNQTAQQTVQTQQDGDALNNWQPQTWGEVDNTLYSRFKEKLMPELINMFRPILDNVQNLTSSNIESKLNEIDPDWKLYEDEMTANLKLHPTLARDVSKLYKLSVPEEVLKNKYTQAALKKYDEKAKSAKVSSKSSVSASSAPTNKKLSFQEAVDEAKRKLGSV
jgi:hypothetical protein